MKFIFLVLVLVISCQCKTFKNYSKVIEDIAVTMADTTLYNRKTEAVLKTFEFIPISNVSDQNCMYCYLWEDKINGISLSLRFFNWPSRDSLLQTIILIIDSPKDSLYDNLFSKIESEIGLPKTIEQHKNIKSSIFTHASTNSKFRFSSYYNAKKELIQIRITLSANTPEEEY